MAIIKSGSARYEGLGKDGVGHVSTGSKALDNQPYGFQTRFEDKPGTNPEELIAAAHAACYSMALSHALAGNGTPAASVDTTAVVGFQPGEGVTGSDLTVVAKVPGLTEEQFLAFAEDAKKGCPVSQALSVPITLNATFVA